MGVIQLNQVTTQTHLLSEWTLAANHTTPEHLNGEGGNLGRCFDSPIGEKVLNNFTRGQKVWQERLQRAT